MTARIRTTHDEIVIQGNYGSKWEDVSFEETMPEARQTLRDYRENEPQYRHRLIVRRVPNTAQGIVSMAEIKSNAKGHWFDASTTRFFNSRYPRTGIRKGNIAYFISSEQFIDSDHVPAKRAYTIRALDYTTGNIATIGEFNAMSKSQAQTELRRILNTN